MRRLLRIGLLALVVVAVLLAVNVVALDNETKPAAVSEPDGELLELDNVTLQYTDRPASGSAPAGAPIVLLHCFACSSAWWEPLEPLIGRRHRVISFDLIGHGGSAKPSSGYEVETQSAAVAQALNELGVRGATVVGHSLGGLVATSLAEQSSDLVGDLVLIATPAQPGQATLPLLARAGTVPVLGQAIWRLRLDSLVKSAYGDDFAPGTDVEGLFDDADRVVADSDAMTYRSYRSLAAAGDDFLDAGSTVSRLDTTGVPVLAIDGGEDQVFDAQRLLADYEAIPGARVVSVDDAGHSPNVEQPKQVADAILGFTDAGGVAPPAATSGAGAKPRAGKGPGAGGRVGQQPGGDGRGSGGGKGGGGKGGGG